MMPSEEPDTSVDASATGQGEEDEDVLFLSLGKLYHYDTAAQRFTNVGTCAIKLLLHRHTSKARILARAEGGVGSIRLNAGVYAHLRYGPVEKLNSVKVPNYGDDGKTIKYAMVRFREAGEAQEFVDKLEECKRGA